MHATPLFAIGLLFGCPASSQMEEARDATRDTEVLAARDPAVSTSAPAAPKTVQALVGTYRHAGGQAEQDALERAVDAVVQDMNVIARGIARSRLLESNRIPASIEISTNEERVTITFDDRKYTAVVDGPAVDVIGITGDPLRMSLRVRDAKLVQRFVGDKGNRTNTMRRQADTLHLHVAVDSDSLPRSLVYDLTFARS